MNDALVYSDQVIARIYNEADDYYRNDNYLLAAEKYDVLYNQGELYYADIIKYARSLGSTEVDRFDDALKVLLEDESIIIEKGYCDKSSYYYQICRIAYWAKEYNLCIKYASKCQYVAEFPMFDYSHATYWMAQSYADLGNSFQCRNTFSTFITSYLKFMEISATDCWDKDYKDDILGNQYLNIALTFQTYGEAKKYYIIAAAWGNKKAIETCKYFEWVYIQKPYDYVY